MGLPILDEIFQGIRWVIDFFMNKAPAPILIIIFLLFLLVFGSLLSFMFQLIGLHCNGDKKVVKVDTWDIATNLGLVWEDRKQVFTSHNVSICEAYPQYCGAEHECYIYAMQLDNGYFVNCNLTNSSSDCRYYLREGNCQNCSEQEICFQDDVRTFIVPFCGQWNSVCMGNAYPIDDSTLNELGTQTGITGCGSACRPPDHYLWNYTSGQYECNEPDYCGLNPTKSSRSSIDQKLIRAGATLLYPDRMSNNIDRAIIIKCNKDYNPTLTFFGVPVLDYRIWMILIVISILATVLFKLKR